MTDYHSNYGVAPIVWKHAAHIVVFYNPQQNTSPHIGLVNQLGVKMACIKITP